MITEQDLLEAIAECQGRRHPDAATCIKLAAFYTILEHIKGESPSYSFAPSPQNEQDVGDEIGFYGETDFLLAIKGKRLSDVIDIMDELMTALAVLNPKLYDSVLRRIDGA